MRIRYLAVVAVLATAILCFGVSLNTVKAACSAGNEATCQINDQISTLQAQLQAMLAQQGQTLTQESLRLQIQILQLQLQLLQLQQGTPTPTPTPPSAAWCHTFTQYLYLGLGGGANGGPSDEVAALQNVLMSEGFLSSTSGDDNGTFGQGTLSALKQFQAKYGVPRTGTTGPITRAKLNSLYGCAPVSCTDSNWTSRLVPEICPASGRQTKIWTKTGVCTGGTSRPDTEFVDCTYVPPSTQPAYMGVKIKSGSLTTGFTPSSIVSITWTTPVNLPVAQNPSIDLLDQNLNYLMSLGQSSSGSFSWAISANFSPGIYHIRITNDGVGNVKDGLSDSFSVIAQYNGSAITVLAPVGGETLTENSKAVDSLSSVDSQSQIFEIKWSGAPDDFTSIYGNKSPARIAAYLEQNNNIVGRIIPQGYGSIMWIVGEVSDTNCLMNNDYTPNYPNHCYYSEKMVPPGTYDIKIVDTQTNNFGRSNNFTIVASPMQSNCTPNWQCQWSQCYGGSQVYTAVDLNKCGTSAGAIHCSEASQQCNPSQPSINVTSPNGGEIVTQGAMLNILWNSSLPTQPVDVSILNSSGQTITSFVQNGVTPSNSSSQSLGFTTSGSASSSRYIPVGQYKAKVCSAGTSSCDQSDSYFTIAALQAIPINSISVDSSNNIHFSFSQIASACLQMKDSQGNYFSLISSQLSYSCANTTLFAGYQTDLIIPESSFTKGIYPGQYYQVCNSDTRGNSYAICSSPILVTSASTQPSITVTYPNAAGMTFNAGAGQVIMIKWNSQGVNNVYIKLRKGNDTYAGPEGIITGTIPNIGSYTWTVPSTLPSGNDYSIRVIDSATLVLDDSDSYFSIVAPAVAGCTDSDNGKDYFTKGTTTDKYGTYTDLCYAATNQVFEYYCDPTLGYSKGLYYTCPNGCANGACKPSTIQSSITVTSPNGGEVLAKGSTVNITWTSNLTDNVMIVLNNYSQGGGGYAIDSVPASSGSYSWKVGATRSGIDMPAGSQYKIEIYENSSVNTASDFSDGYFTIAAAAYNYPTVTVPSTTSNVLILGAQNQIGQVTVAASPQGSVKVRQITFGIGENWFSSTLGLSSITIANGTTQIYGSNCVAGASPIAISGAVTCTLGNSYPTDYIIPAGQSVTFNLFATVNGTVISGSGSNPSVSSILSPAGFIWDDTSTNGASGVGLTGSIINNFPIGSYTISQSGGTQSSITVTSPSVNNQWVEGTTVAVTWTSLGLSSSDKVSVMLYGPFDSAGNNTGSQAHTIAPNIYLNGGLYSWNVGTVMNLSGYIQPGNYKIVVSDWTDGYHEVHGTSGLFALSAPSTQPSVTVTSPNGSEQWTQGSTHNITWTSTGSSSSATATIALQNLGSSSNSTTIIATNVPIANGSYSWTIPSTMSLGSQYRIQVYGMGYSPTDYSDNYFSIVAPTATPLGLLSVSLDGATPIAQNLSSGQTNITFTKVKLANATNTVINNLNGIQVGSTYPNLENIKVYNADTNTQLGATVLNLTSNGAYYYAWVMVSGVSLPANTSTTLKIVADVKATASAGTARVGVAGLNFDSPGCTTTGMPVFGNNMTIVSNIPQPSVTVTSPNGGETWNVGETHDITWTSSGVDKVAIYAYGYDSTGLLANASLKIIATGVAGSAGKYTWAISSDFSTFANKDRMKIYVLSYGSTSSNTTADFSDNYFSITSLAPICTPNWQCSAWGTCNATASQSQISDYMSQIAQTQTQLAQATSNEEKLRLQFQLNLQQFQLRLAQAGPYQIRTCTDLNNCGVLTGKPAESQACTVVQPTITVTSLNGGETLTQGQTYNITWTSTGLGSQAGTISLIGGSLQNIGITGSVPLSAGTYSWTVPTQYYTLGSNFKIFIDNGNNSPGVNDYSDNYFSIVAPVATCTDSDVTTAYPDGKDYFTKGTATDKYGTYTDLCYAATNQVFEYYCDPTLGYSKGVYYTCPNGCADGACKPATYGLNTQAQAIASLLDAYAQLISYLKNTPSQ